MPPATNPVTITDDLQLGGRAPLLLVAGPCVIEDRDTCLRTAEHLAAAAQRLKCGFIFKASFDKANRSSIDSFRGPGLDQGLAILADVKEQCGVAVTSDIHLPDQAAPAAEVLDLIQIPAFLCRQTDLLTAATDTQRPVNVKKGQFLSPEDVPNIRTKVASRGNEKICITERGITFGYRRLVNDFSGIEHIRRLGIPVIFDATHSVQQPGGLGDRSGGARDMVPCLARAAAGAGIDGLFLETHPEPDQSASDGPNMLPLDSVEELVKTVLEIDAIVRK